MIVDVESRGEEKASIPEEWTPTKNEWLIMISLAFISLMVALDATILVTVLPVSLVTKCRQKWRTDLVPPGDSTKAQWDISRGLLGWHIVPPHVRHLPADHSLDQSDFRSSTTPHSLTPALHCRHSALYCSKRLHLDADWTMHPGSWRRRYNHTHPSHLLRHCTPEATTQVLPTGPRFLVRGVRPWPVNRRCTHRACILALVLHRQLPILPRWLRRCDRVRSSQQSR
jgi:hypothetical protein